MLALAGLVRRLGGSPLAVSLAPWTVLLTDFSFVSAALPGTRWWSDVFRGNILISLAFTNPVVPALALALGCLVALHRYESGEGRAWLALAVLQAAAVPWFKVFLGAQLALSLALAALLVALRGGKAGETPPAPAPPVRGGRPPRRRGPAGLPAAPPRRDGGAGRGGVAPLRMVGESLRDSGSAARPRAGCFSPPFRGSRLAGPAQLGLPAAWKASSPGGPRPPPPRGSRCRAGRSACSSTSRPGTSRSALPSATIYFVEQSGAVLWVFTAIAVAAWAGRARRPALVIGLAGLLSLPSTLEFVVRKARGGPDSVPAGAVRALAAIARDGRPGDVVLQRPGARYRRCPPSSSAAGWCTSASRPT